MPADLGRVERMAAMYRRGVPMPDIARQFSVNPPAVRQALIRAGVHTPGNGVIRNRTHRDELKASLAEHMAEGGTLSNWSGKDGLMNFKGVRKLWASICADVGEPVEAAVP